MGYKEHGLTNMQDIILGGFGMFLDEEGLPTEDVRLDEYRTDSTQTRESIRKAAKELQVKGLLYVDNDTAGHEVYHLTVKGKQLWKTRSKEEEEGPYE